MIDAKIANRVWNVLLDAGASERERDAWLSYAVGRDDIPEYRFRGALGFGGKVRLSGGGYWHVYYYPEDKNEEREVLRHKINKALANIATTTSEQEGGVK